jgi:hypothetical protein
LEIGRGDVLGTALMLAPFYKQTVGDATVHCENQDAIVSLDPAAVVVVGDIQPVMQATHRQACAFARRSGLRAAPVRLSRRRRGQGLALACKKFDASILSDEASATGLPNFVGAFLGMACQDLAGTFSPAEFDSFEYRERGHSADLLSVS